MPATKTGRRVHDLSTAALQVLGALPRLNRLGLHDREQRGRSPIAPSAKHFAEAATAAGLADVRLHDLRRTVMTAAAAAGVGTHMFCVILLGHRDNGDGRSLYPNASGNPCPGCPGASRRDDGRDDGRHRSARWCEMPRRPKANHPC